MPDIWAPVLRHSLDASGVVSTMASLWLVMESRSARQHGASGRRHLPRRWTLTTLERMLRRRDAAEARRGRYPVEVRLHVLSGPPKFRTLETVFVKSGEQGWAQVVAAIPSPLPRPYEAYGYDYDFGCRSGYYEVTVFLLNGDQVDYGPCLRPPEVEPLRRALLRLLQQKR